MQQSSKPPFDDIFGGFYDYGQTSACSLGQIDQIDLGRAILLLNFPSHAASGRG